jgi:hypothetical protein
MLKGQLKTKQAEVHKSCAEKVCRGLAKVCQKNSQKWDQLILGSCLLSKFYAITYNTLLLRKSCRGLAASRQKVGIQKGEKMIAGFLTTEVFFLSVSGREIWPGSGTTDSVKTRPNDPSFTSSLHSSLSLIIMIFLWQIKFWGAVAEVREPKRKQMILL